MHRDSGDIRLVPQVGIEEKKSLGKIVVFLLPYGRTTRVVSTSFRQKIIDYNDTWSANINASLILLIWVTPIEILFDS